MTDHAIRVQIHLVSAMTANRAALQLLNRVMDEGIAGEPPV